jgi:hypothetical protein
MPDNRKPNALAVDLMQRATLSQLREDATDLAGLVRAIQKPLPTLPVDATERELALMILLLQARERERRLLTLLVSGDVRS